MSQTKRVPEKKHNRNNNKKLGTNVKRKKPMRKLPKRISWKKQ